MSFAFVSPARKRQASAGKAANASTREAGGCMAKKLLMGNEAFAQAALEAGVRVVAGYPGTPSSEVIETIEKRVASGAAQGVHVEWSTNEKAALEVLAGASYAGARCLFTCKQVGLNVASDALMSLNYVGTQGGLVLFVADDPGPISSQTEQDTRRFASFAKVPVFDPENIEQGFAMMQAAFDVSERYRCPVIVRPTTRVCHSSTFVDAASHTTALDAQGFQKDDARWVIFPARAQRGHAEVNARLKMIAAEFSGQAPVSEALREEVAASNSAVLAACLDGAAQACANLSHFNPIEVHGEAPRVGIVCGGVSTAYAKEALSILEQACEQAQCSLPSYAFMQVGTPYPFPEKRASEFVDGLDAVIVFEELDSVLEDEFVRLMGLRAARGQRVARVFGRRAGMSDGASASDSAKRAVGENTVERVYECLVAFFAEQAGLRSVSPRLGQGQTSRISVPPRPPVLCAGCPHRGAFYAAKRALKKLRVRGVFSGDIGCYTLGNAAPLDAVDTCLCMGAGITMAQGLGVADPEAKQLAFVGDSTFFASGLTGVANAVYNQHDITVCVLDNSITAMTGGQPHPGTGKTLMGTMSEPLSIERALESLGVACIEYANPHCLEESIEAVQKAVSFEGPAAVIFRAPCINLVKPHAPAVIDGQACTGCRKCIASIGCPAIGLGNGVAVVDAAQCTGCGLCAQVCPFNVIELPDARDEAPRVAQGAACANEASSAEAAVSSQGGEA